MVSLALDPPPSSRGGSPRNALRRALMALALVATLGVGFWLGRITARPKEGAAPATAPPTAIPTPTTTATATTTTTATATTTATPTGGTTAGTPVPVASGPRRLSVALNGPLEESIARALGDRARAEELTQVVNRLLVWELQVARDGRKGDRLEVLWKPAEPAAPGLPASGEPVVEAVRYASQKSGQVFAAYRFQPDGAKFARYYRADGTELETRLVDAPVGDYEQVTSLLRDGRRHKGIDFKTPVGSPVHATFDGVIERRNWNFAGNGNCLDVRDRATGRHAIFLHLDVLPEAMKPGRAVKKGDVIASSGNSGHSFAPHLHYQLEAPDGRILDPFEVQRTERHALETAHKAAFETVRARCDTALKG